MTQLLVVVLGLAFGVGASRLLRRPSRPARAAAEAASLARSVGGTVGARRDLDLPHLQRSALSEMLRHVVGRGSAATVPASYTIRLHPDDYATVDQAPGFFKQGLEQAVASAGRDNRWSVPSRLTIALAPDPGVRRGAPAVDTGPMAAAAVIVGATDRPAPPVQPPPPASAGPPADTHPEATGGADERTELVAGPHLALDDGRVHVLDRSPVTIGRGSDRTLRVDDKRVSRHHATIAPAGHGYSVTDDGSSNGTTLNGHPLAARVPTDLQDGDRVGVGPVQIVFHARHGAGFRG